MITRPVQVLSAVLAGFILLLIACEKPKSHELSVLSGKNKPIPILYFYSADCGICEKIKDNVFPWVESTYGVKLDIYYLNIDKNTNIRKLLYIEKKLGYKSTSFPVVFVGTNEAAGEDAIMMRMPDMMNAVLSNPESIDRALLIYKAFTPDASGNNAVRERLGIISVIGAGLLDGINPCAFSTLIFLIAFLAFLEFDRRRILITGVFYTLGVFLAYLGVGIGAFETLKALSVFKVIALIIKYASIGLLALVFVLSLVDLIRYMITKKSDFILHMPDAIKRKIHENIHSKLKSGNLFIAAFILGVVIAFFELACTGQVYLPTILYIINVPDLRLQGLALLVLYNICFIVPLVAVFVAAYAGMSSKLMESVFKKNLLLIKILLTLIFGFLLWYVVK
jgi:cytochrome c biogenesis protein CcdA